MYIYLYIYISIYLRCIYKYVYIHINKYFLSLSLPLLLSLSPSLSIYIYIHVNMKYVDMFIWLVPPLRERVLAGSAGILQCAIYVFRMRRHASKSFGQYLLGIRLECDVCTLF